MVLAKVFGPGRIVNCVQRRLWKYRYMSLKVPQQPTWTLVNDTKLTKETEVDSKLIEQLERLALVNFNSEDGIRQLSQTIRFADHLHLVDTTGVEPMESVLQDRFLYLREDEVTEGNCKHAILANAAKTEEDYFVSPPGNVPLTSTSKDKIKR